MAGTRGDETPKIAFERPISGVQRRVKASAPPEIGAVVEELEVVACVSRNARGTLLVARGQRDPRTERLLAFPPSSLYADPDAMDTLRAEAGAASRLSHPNVLGVDGLRYWNGLAYLRLEHVRGVTLARMARLGFERRLVPTTYLVGALGLRIARALHALHRALDPEGATLGMVQHGLFPSDVVIDLGSGALKVVPVSLRRLVGRKSAILAGRFASPEERAGVAVDARADVWAVGTILAEMAFGRRYSHDPGEDGRAGRREAIAAIAARGGAFETLAQLLGTLTAIDPTERPASPAELAQLIAMALPSTQELGDAVLARVVTALATGDEREITRMQAVGLLAPLD